MAAKSNKVSNIVINRYANVSDKYDVIERIARGSYGIVMMAKDVKTKEKMAIKVIELDFLEEDVSKALIKETIKEAELMSKLDHSNILKYYECFQDYKCVCIVLEYCEETLTKVLRTHLNDQTRPSEQLVIEWFYKLSLGLDYLHDRNIIHRDIKPMNILFKNSEIKIADFGESRLKSQATMTVRGTKLYMSPEMLRYEKFTEKTDIWSLGCVFYEINYLEIAFDSDSEYTLIQNVYNRKTKHLDSDNTEIANLIDMMLNTNKDERISIKEVLSHKVLKSFTKDTFKKVEVAEKDEDNSNAQKVDFPELIKLCNSYASENAYKDVAALLIQNEALVNEKNEAGETALMLASENGQKEAVALLIQNEALVNEKNVAASKEGHDDVVALLIQNKALVNERNEAGETALMLASENGQKEVVALLIEDEALVNERNEAGETAIILASENGQKEAVALLIQNEALVNKKNVAGKTALMLAKK